MGSRRCLKLEIKNHEDLAIKPGSRGSIYLFTNAWLATKINTRFCPTKSRLSQFKTGLVKVIVYSDTNDFLETAHCEQWNSADFIFDIWEK